jgi:hypothetical protein
VPADLDDTFYPVLLSRIEEPLARAEAEAYFRKIAELADRALRNGERYVVIVTSEVETFSAAGRRAVADAQAAHLTPERIAVALAALVPFDSAIVRGAMTALRWVSPRLVDSIQPVSSLDAAVDEALRILEANRTPFRGDVSALRRKLAPRSRA